MKEKYKLMIVDDEPWALIGLEEIISWQEEGFEIVARCSCGQEALDALEYVRPDVLITDIRMPDMTGLALIEKMRGLLPNLEAVVISAYSDFLMAKKAINLGVCSYILKPLDADEVRQTAEDLREKLYELLGHKSLGHEVIDIDPKKIVFPQIVTTGKVYYFILTKIKFERDDELQENDYFQKVRIGEYYGLLTDQLPNQVPDFVGISIGVNDFSEGAFLYKTALASLKGGFRFSESVISGKSQHLVVQIQLYLYEHMNENITLRELSESFFVSETYVCDLFKKYTGETITGFLRKIRINNSKLLLMNTDMSLKEIAYGCGYNDYSYFGRHFKNIVGLTPDLYRKSKG